MKRLLTELFKCRCGYMASLYKGTKIKGYDCPKCHSAKYWTLLKGDNNDN